MKKTVIVTGAANGIGKAITERSLKDGFHVFALDINDTLLTSLKSEYGDFSLTVFKIDISDPNQVRSFFDWTLEQGKEISCLVNNAGIYFGKNILEYSIEEINRVIQVNCLGAVYLSQEFARRIISKGHSGNIVNMSSVAGEEGSSDAIYGLSKAAILGLTKSCAINFAPTIRVNAVAPALVNTDLIRNVPEWRMREYRASELLKDPILSEDVANTVSFLLSDQSKHYTGAVFDINNGQYRR